MGEYVRKVLVRIKALLAESASIFKPAQSLSFEAAEDVQWMVREERFVCLDKEQQ